VTTVATELAGDLVAANRILALQGVVDGYGHVSARDPGAPDRFWLAWARAPELVEPADLMAHGLDGEPRDAGGRTPYSERFIHSEIYRLRPDVRAVVHHHSPSVIPFGAGGVPLRPIYHMSAFLGTGAPVWEIRAAAGGPTDMLVRTPALGRSLAETLGAGPAALMRGHGAVVAGTSLPQVVARSIYLELNARLQLQAIQLGGDVTYLDAEEARRATEMMGGYERAWELWKRRVS
jgi:ribulose-5-phosphate 4-epimerase/fuculose-1-phosphate aldolase